MSWLREQIAWLRDDPVTTVLCWLGYLVGAAAVVTVVYLIATGHEIHNTTIIIR